MRGSFLKLHHIFAFAVRTRARAVSQSSPRKTTQNTRGSPKKRSSSLDGEKPTCKLSLISNSFRRSSKQTTVQEYYIREHSSSNLRACQSLSLTHKWLWYLSYSTQRDAGKTFPGWWWSGRQCLMVYASLEADCTVFSAVPVKDLLLQIKNGIHMGHGLIKCYQLRPSGGAHPA